MGARVAGFNWSVDALAWHAAGRAYGKYDKIIVAPMWRNERCPKVSAL
jgi:hypothetical protein